MRHSKEMHMYRYPFKLCRICNNKVFNSIDELKYHLKVEHPEKYDLLFWSEDGIFFHS
jgi:hypothetical protein